MERKQLKYTSLENQNDFLSIMAQQVLCEIVVSLPSAVFQILVVDETTDTANNEQIILVYQWVDDALVAHEEFVGHYVTDFITSEALMVVCARIVEFAISESFGSPSSRRGGFGR